MSQLIQAGKVYWVTFEGQRIHVRAIKPSDTLRGWWECTSCATRQQLSFPATANWELDTDAQTDCT